MPSAQVRSALAYANECRALRFELAKEVRAGGVRLSEVLREPTIPNWLEGAIVAPLLLKIPGFGKTRVNALLADLHISQLRRLRELTYRQRRQLADELAIEEEAGGYSLSGRRARQHRSSITGRTVNSGVTRL